MLFETYWSTHLKVKMPATSPHFIFRTATSDDGPFIVSAFDAGLPYLASIGSQEQWGLTPFSQREGWVEETMKQLSDSIHNQYAGSSDDVVDGGIRCFIVELDYPADAAGVNSEEELLEENVSVRTVGGSRFLKAGFVFVHENWCPEYIKGQKGVEMGDVEIDCNIYLEVMVTDYRIGELRRGAGKALIEGLRNYAREKQAKVLCVDGWAGNERKLIK